MVLRSTTALLVGSRTGSLLRGNEKMEEQRLEEKKEKQMLNICDRFQSVDSNQYNRPHEKVEKRI